MENTNPTPENSQIQPVLPDVKTPAPEKKHPKTATFTARIDYPSYTRLADEAEDHNLPLSTYATSVIKECWKRREAEKAAPDVDSTPKAKLPDAKPNANGSAQTEAAKKEGANLAKAPQSLDGIKALEFLRTRFKSYTDAQLIAAALMNVAANESAFLFLTDFSTTLKKLPHEA